jgi:5'-nucleotidase
MRIYVDMDNTMCDYSAHLYNKRIETGHEYPQSLLNFYKTIPPIHNAVESVKRLQNELGHDVWIATRPSFMNMHCYTEKIEWVKYYFGDDMQKRTILIPDKSLLVGDVLIDDHTEAGQLKFNGIFIQYGTPAYDTWDKVLKKIEELG